MERHLATAALVAMLIIVTAGLGLVLGGGGGLQGNIPGGQPKNQTTENSKQGPFFLVLTQTEAGGATTGTAIESSARVPVQGVRFVIQGLPTFFRGRLQSNQVTTNSTGMGEIAVPPGNFTVLGAGPDINYKGFVVFKANTTTYLSVVVTPARGDVASVVVANQDTLAGVEPTGTIYVGIPGNVSFAPGVLSELAGGTTVVTRSSPSDLAGIAQFFQAVNVTVLGSYPSPEGTTVVLRPAGNFPGIPSSGLALIQYRLNSTVSYIAV